MIKKECALGIVNKKCLTIKNFEMKKFRFTMGTLILAMMATTFMACKKENNRILPPIINGIEEKKPLATMVTETGKVSYSFNIEDLQGVLNKQMPQKNVDRYYLETVEIVEAIPVGDTSFSGLQIVIIDTETENSITVWASEAFIDKVVYEDSVCYYLSKEVEGGCYSFINYGDEISNVSVVDHRLDSVTPCYQPGGPLFCISCTSHLCSRGCLPIKPQLFGWTCTECKGDNPQRYCDITIDNSGYLAVIGVILAILAL